MEKDGEWWRRFFRPDYWFLASLKHQYRWFSEELENKKCWHQETFISPKWELYFKECCIEFIRNLCDSANQKWANKACLVLISFWIQRNNNMLKVLLDSRLEAVEVDATKTCNFWRHRCLKDSVIIISAIFIFSYTGDCADDPNHSQSESRTDVYTNVDLMKLLHDCKMVYLFTQPFVWSSRC